MLTAARTMTRSLAGKRLSRSLFGLTRSEGTHPVSAVRRSEDPFMDLFSRRMNRLFDEFPFGTSLINSPEWNSLLKPTATMMDVCESDKQYIVTMDLPGVQKEDISVTVKDHVVTVSGQRKSSFDEKKKEGDQVHVVERAFGSFSRSFSLPKDASQDELKASMEHGVLKLEIGKTEVPEDEGIKKIEVQ
ncbi:Heat shock protein HSP 90-beta [Chytriomyces hyalinus]|nr:Heat shock protein HSP 90-beta [Chytriomyces hyalinus]